MATNNEEFVPAQNGNYIERKFAKMKDTELLEKAHKNKKSVLLIGETGTGKTHVVRHFCHKHKLPYMRVNLNESTTVEDLVGQWVPEVAGGFKWQDGVLTRFMRHGGVFVCDEINAATAGILFILHSVLDDEKKLVLVQKDGEVLHAHPDFWFVSTMNPDYEGTKPLNNALKDRFAVTLYYDYDRKIEAKLITNDRIQSVAEKLRPMFEKGELLTPISTRAMMQFCDNLNLFGEDLAVEMFLNKFSREEARAISSVLELAFKGKTKNALIEGADEDIGDDND